MTTEAKWSDFASMDGPKLLAAANQLLPAWVSLLLVVLIAWQLAKLAWMLVPAPASGDIVVTPVLAQVSQGSETIAADVNAIANAHIFGFADPDAEVAAPIVVEEDVKRDTRLNLALKGTIASDPSEQAIAIISEGGRNEKIYVVGDTVASNTKLHAVYADRVVLSENGVLTNLKLPKEFPAGSSMPMTRSAPLAVEQLEPDDSQSIQAVVTQNVAKLADVIRPTPYFVNGEQQGYRVYPGRNRAQFSALGLRPGDLIKDIDGQALSDPTQAMQIFQSLGSTDQVSVTVERNGQPEIIVLSTSQLDIADDTSQ